MESPSITPEVSEPHPGEPQHAPPALYNCRGKRMVGEAGGPETGYVPLPKTQRP